MSAGVKRAAARAGVEQLAASAAGAAADRLAETLRAELPGVSVNRIAGGVEIVGRGLGARLFAEPALRWPGGLIR